ncbi:MAG: hypothetical protein ACI9O6_003356, partial [Glaciecola sp.]
MQLLSEAKCARKLVPATEGSELMRLLGSRNLL